MARETKVGMLIGLGVILLIGIIVSDHLSVTRPDSAEAMTDFAPQAQRGIDPEGNAQPTSSRGLSAAKPRIDAPPTNSSAPTRAAPAPRFDEPDRLTIPDSASPLDRLPETESADAASPKLADLPAPPQAWRTTDTTWSPHPGNATADIRPPSRGLSEAKPRIDSQETTPATTAAVTPAPQPALPQRQPGAELIHHAQRGDTLTALASRYYGDSDYWSSIAAANRGAFDPQGNVVPGTRLIIPNRAGHVDNPDQARELLATGLFEPASRPRAGQPATAGVHPPRRSATAERTVEVLPGDSLSRIAARHLGSEKLYLKLYEANRDQLDSPDMVKVGMKLRLPNDADATTTDTPAPSSRGLRSAATKPRIAPQDAPAPSTTPATTEAKTATTYTVQAGDNLSRIAEKALGDRNRWEEIFKANTDQLASPDMVKVGQKLRIPSS